MNYHFEFSVDPELSDEDFEKLETELENTVRETVETDNNRIYGICLIEA